MLEEGRLLAVERGTPQGAVISPLLANIYLHYVYDLWVHQWRRRHAGGEVIVVRYADDTVVGFQQRSDAERFLDELRQRLQRFGLELHPEKTRIIEFGRFAARNRKARGLGKPETFAFLGFTHICGTSKGGALLILRHTVRERLREKLRQVKEKIRRMMHRPIAEQGLYLRRVMNGFFNYYAVPTNSRAINSFYHHVVWHWCRALRRRGQSSRLTWQRMKRLTDRWLPPARSGIPSRRAVQRHDPRQEPGAVVPLAGICAGGGEQSPSLPRRFFCFIFNELLERGTAWPGCRRHHTAPLDNARSITGPYLAMLGALATVVRSFPATSATAPAHAGRSPSWATSSTCSRCRRWR